MRLIRVTIAAGPTETSLLVAGQSDVQIEGLMLQPDDGATNPMFIGPKGVMTGATPAVYAIRLNAPSGGAPPPALWFPFKGQLSQLFVIGTATEILTGYAVVR